MWSDIKPENETMYEIESRTVYRYRDKCITTSNMNELTGWILYDSETDWGEWSEWQEEKVDSGSARNIETQEVKVSDGYTQYRYWRWQSNNCSKGTWWHFCDTCGKILYGGTWYKKYAENGAWMDTPITNIGTGNQCSHGYSYRNDGQKTYRYDGQNYYLQETRYVEPSYRTQYRYQDLVTTYYFYQWGEWSEWSEVQPVASENRDTEMRLEYRYKKSTSEELTEKENNDATSGSMETGSVDTSGTSVSSKLTEVKKGSRLVVSNVIYRITSTKKATVTYLGCQRKKEKSITVPAKVQIQGKIYKVTEIADGAFQNDTKLKRVNIGSNVVSIGKNAFKGCKRLETLILGENVKVIGISVFEGCKQLEEITITCNVTSIGRKAFYNCRNLKNVIVESNVIKSIGKKAFGKTSDNRGIRLKGISDKQQKKYRQLFENAVW